MNKLIIAAAGSGKTTMLVKKALEIKDQNVIITTFTDANEAEINKKFIELNGVVPHNITIQTWFSFLLAHGARPFQGVLTEKKITGLLLVNSQSAVKYYYMGRPICFPESTDTSRHYFDEYYRIYSDKLAKFVFRCNEITSGAVISRIERSFPNIFIDEIQDMAGYDLDLIRLFMQSSANVFMVGDPRQVAYHTHNEPKNKQYINGEIERYIRQCCKGVSCDIDRTSLNETFRNCTDICNFANSLFPEYTPCLSNQNYNTGHDGVFIVKKKDVSTYLETYESVMQLRDSRATSVNDKFPVMNFGISKGLTFNRVLIYPTAPISAWLKKNKELAFQSKSKFYVAITRAMFSVAIALDYNPKTDSELLRKYKTYCC